MVLKNRLEIKGSGLNGHRYKELLRLQAKRPKTPDHLLEETNKGLIADSGSPTDTTKNSDEANTESFDLPCKAGWNNELETLPCDITKIQDVTSTTEVLNENQNLDAPTLNSASDRDHDSHLTEIRLDKKIECEQLKCVVCCQGGKLLYCAGKGCSKSYHFSCVNPPFIVDQLGVWHCACCVEKKVEIDVYSVSEGVESVLDAKGMSDDDAKEKQQYYLVKYKGLAHVHNRWISEKDLLLQAPSVFARFRKRNQKGCWKKDWSIPQRVLAKRLLPNKSNTSLSKLDGCQFEWLVKWKGLEYNHASWELENAPFLRTPNSLKLIHDFEDRHRKEKEEPDHLEIDKGRRTSCAPLEDLPSGCPDHAVHVNKLYECWKMHQNAIVIDEQERVIKAVLFLLSLLKERRGPFLIVTTSTAIPLWEDEFMQWASHANVIVYKGSRDVRRCIRNLELFDEGGSIMFQILLAHHMAFDEDLEYFKPVKWEVILIDECQCPSMSARFELVKMLSTNMRLLLASNEIKDWSFNYDRALSLLDPEYSGVTEDIPEVDPILDKLKKRIVHFFAYQCKRDPVQFAEFWVPVMLTDVQIELYCASLFSKAHLLCSSLRTDSTGSLHELLVSIKKTCDHPFLTDWSLRNLVLKGVPEANHFDVEIQSSAKLQFLNKFLSEMEGRGLRVLIYFQSTGGPEMISIGDVLDDFIHQKFGGDSYVRIDGNMSRATKKAAINRFNCKENGTFVCLIEARACLPSTKVVSVDTVILYNSDWDPLNDLRAIQKVTIDSQFEQLKVFRLYSSCTVEEKVLILAKEGMTVGSNVKSIKKAICHKLLTWGASLLFSKFDASVEHDVTSLDSNNCLGDKNVEDLCQELSLLLPCSSRKHDAICVTGKDYSSHVLEVQQDGCSYFCGFPLSGELIADSKDNFSIIRHLMDAEPPDVFWKNLLEWRQPRWKYMSNQPQRSKRKVQCIEGLAKGSERKGPNRSKVVSGTENHMLKLIPVRQMIPQNSATKRYRSVHTLLNDNPDRQRKKKRKTMEGNGGDAHQAVSSSMMGMQSVNNPGPVNRSPAASGSLTSEIPLSADLGSPIDGGIEQNNNRIFILASDQGTQASGGASQSASSASLEAQMLKINEAKEKAIKFHEFQKLQIEAEYKKELEEVHKKYNVLFKKTESALAKKITCLGDCHNSVHKHKSLAEAMSGKQGYASATWSGQQGDLVSAYIRQGDSYSLAVDDSAEKDAATAEPNTVKPSDVLPMPENLVSQERMPAAEILATTVSAAQDRSLARAAPSKTSSGPAHLPVMTTNQPGRLLIPSIHLARTSARQGHCIRAPAPHLRNARPITRPLNSILPVQSSSGLFRHSTELASDVDSK